MPHLADAHLELGIDSRGRRYTQACAAPSHLTFKRRGLVRATWTCGSLTAFSAFASACMRCQRGQALAPGVLTNLSAGALIQPSA
eukprot:1655638-Pyramimonas_sp.AAC.1